MLEDQLDYIVGVDPHRDEHAVAVVEVVSGAVVSVGVKTLCPRPRSERATPVPAFCVPNRNRLEVHDRKPNS